VAEPLLDRLETRGKEQQQPPTNPIERLKRVADALSRRGAVLKQIADAAAPLYQSLDDGQKERFRILSRATIRLQMRGWSLENR